jgi:5-methylthioribose kinase
MENATDELDAESSAGWLEARGFAISGLRSTELGGGVSNRVILAEAPTFRAVLKQSLGRLKVEREWLSDRIRIFREAEAMRWLNCRVRGGRIPRVLCEDPASFAIAMEAAPRGAVMWKTRLLAGEADRTHARSAGTMLGSIVSASWNHPEARRLFGDQTVFEQLRIEPYYRFTAARHPRLKGYFDNLIAQSQARRVSLVHGDWSPKNLLVGAGPMWAIDWEVVHFGDPSFDAAFLLNHLLMKSIAMPEMRSRLSELALEFTDALALAVPPEAGWMEAAALEHLPALLLARVDGKSPAEYLDEAGRDRARQLAMSLMANPATSVREAFTR